MFDWAQLSEAELAIALGVIGPLVREPDLIIAPDGRPYLYRWHLVRNQAACVYFHIQVADDPERPLHDHPWDNHSVILSGGYKEIICMSKDCPTPENTWEFHRRQGQSIWRAAEWSHRLLMDGHPRTMTLFSTGPKRREWGFWYLDRWVPFTEVTKMDGNVSTHKKLEPTS